MKQPNQRRRILPVVAGLLIAALAMLLATLPSEYLLVGPALEPFARGLYRIAYFVRLPILVIVAAGIPWEDHHPSQPLFFHSITCLLAPPFWWLGWQVLHAMLRGLRRAMPPALRSFDDSISRRAFLGQAATGLCVAAPLCVGGYSALVEPQRLQIRKYTFPLPNLPDDLVGLRVVHMGDTHFGPFVSRPYIEYAVDEVNKLKGDLILLTGDYVHRTPKSIEPGIKLLQRLKARHGILATLGNHDHWEGAAACRVQFKQIGIPLIDNARVFLTGKGLASQAFFNRALCIGGIGDLWEDDTDFQAAVGQLPDDMPRILLSHNPDAAELRGQSFRIDLMLSGHTHGGQVWLPGIGTPFIPSHYGQKYAGGLVQGPHHPVLVTRGVGMSGIPVRFCVEPEISEITFTRA